MKKQKKQMIFILALLAVFVAAYAGMHVYNKNQKEKADKEAEAGKIYVTKEKQEDITAFSYQMDDSTLTFVKEGDGWVLRDDEETKLDQSAVTSILERLVSLEAEDTVENPESLSEYGFDEPANVVTFTTAEGSVTLTIGMQNPVTDQYYLTKSGDDALYLVSSGFPSAFEKTAEDLKASAEESTEEIPQETES